MYKPNHTQSVQCVCEGFVFVPGFVILFFKPFLVLKSSRWGCETIRIYHECEGKKIRPEDHRLTSRGLQSDDKR